MRHSVLWFLLNAFLIVFLIACKTTTETTTTTTSQTTTTTLSLAIPADLELDGRIVRWSAVASATGYILLLNEQEISVSENEYTLPNSVYGDVSLAVKSLREAEESAYSATLETVAILKLIAPANLVQDGNTIRWDPVDGATGYVLKINGVEYLTNNLFYEWMGLSSQSVQVLAAGRLDGILQSSDYSAAITLKASLTTPANIQQTDGILTWDDVENATGYLIQINEGDFVETTVATLDLQYQIVGSTTIHIQAIDDTLAFLASGYGEATLVFAVLTMPIPTDIVIFEGILSFSAVPYASGYEISANGVSLEIIDSTTFTIPAELLNEAGSYLEIRTLSELHNPSEWSIPVVCQIASIGTEAELRAMTPTGSYILTNDIILSAPWTPMPFQGSFNGNHYTISGILITADLPNIGFFSELDGAVIRNLTLAGEIDVETTSLSPNVGGLAGNILHSEITNVSIRMDLSATSLNGIGKLGGFVGLLESTNITQSSFQGSIHAEYFLAGGFIGKAGNPDSLKNVSMCQSSGLMIIQGGESTYSGGFIGLFLDNTLTISESIADMNHIGTNYVGGFVGYMGSGTIADCLSRGSVTAAASSNVMLGGFVGRMEGYNNQVLRSIAFVTVSGPTTGSDINVGGFAGKTPGGTFATLYTNCLYNTTLSSIDRIGNPLSGRGDGITGRSASQLQTSNAGFNLTVWTFDASGPQLLWETEGGDE